MLYDEHDYPSGPSFGVHYLNLIDAARLVTKCLWFDNQIEKVLPDKEYYSLHDPDLERALEKEIQEYLEILVSAIQRKSLKAAHVSNDVKGNILPESTYIESFDLGNWFDDHHLPLGPVYYEDYMEEEWKFSCLVQDFVKVERLRQRKPDHLTKKDLKSSPEIILMRDKIFHMENEILRLKAKDIDEKPITEKQRSSYLNIIAALLGLLLGKSSSGVAYSQFSSQQSIIDSIQANYGEKNGLSKRNLEDKFSKAKRNLEGM